MNFMMFWQRLSRFFAKFLARCVAWVKGLLFPVPKISLLVPFQSTDPCRLAAWDWLYDYWQHELPRAEIIVGRSTSTPFCKGEALNDAASRSHGKVLVILDADAYLEGKVINACADRILAELDNHLWFVPYRHLYRLNRRVTRVITSSDPTHPLRLASPPPADDIDNTGQNSSYGHRYGAMIMMIPRQAYEVLGGFDTRFVGWGAEDISLLRALDVLWGKHKTTANAIYHLWHPFLGITYKQRIWDGQEQARSNEALAQAYHRAMRSPAKMRALVDEGRTRRLSSP